MRTYRRGLISSCKHEDCWIYSFGPLKKIINWKELLITQVAVCKRVQKKLERTLAR
jgi:hypothetical protein